MSVSKTLYDALIADSDVAAQADSYLGSPAVFTAEVPEDAPDTFIHLSRGNVSDLPFDTKTWIGREIVRDVYCYGPDTGSDVAIDNLAEAVRAVLHRASFSLGSGTIICEAGGPIIAPTGENVVGRVVSVRITYQH